MKWIKAAEFPKPVQHGSHIPVGPGSRWVNLILLIATVSLVLGAIYQGGLSSWRLSWWQWAGCAVISVLLSLPVHELLHLLAHPKFGTSTESKIGAGGLKSPALWVGYADWVLRKRAIVILLTPFATLAIFVPLCGLLVGHEAGSFLSSIGAVNIFASRNDIITSISLSQSRSFKIYESDNGYYEE